MKAQSLSQFKALVHHFPFSNKASLEFNGQVGDGYDHNEANKENPSDRK